MHTFVLVHSPLVGPLSWSLVAAEIRRRGLGALTPALTDRGEAGGPYWKQHASSVAQALDAHPPGDAIILVGHSGAGMLLPSIRQLIKQETAGYIYVDADIPQHGTSRLGMVCQEMPEIAVEFRQALTGGALLPAWNDDDLRESIPGDGLRRGILAELHPRPLAFFEEPIPVFQGWPDRPCGYVRFSRTGSYAASVARAQQEGWGCKALDGAHFHMLVDPISVANALIGLVEDMGTDNKGADI